jgi:hypothetical protein
MQIDFIVGGQVKYSAKLKMKKEELLPDYYENKKQKFKIPINVFYFINFRKVKFHKDLEQEVIYRVTKISMTLMKTNSNLHSQMIHLMRMTKMKMMKTN